MIFRYIARRCVFYGGVPPTLTKLHVKGSIFIREDVYIKDTGLSGKSFKICDPNPPNDSLKDKVVLVFGPNADSSARIVDSIRICDNEDCFYQLARRGATIIGIDYRGYGNSAPISRFKISENTVYKDAEDMYNYVRTEMKVAPENIITFGYSMGAAAASHVLEYASKKNEKLCGVVLASPINNLSSAASAFTFSALGKVTSFLCGSKLNTEKNLSNVKDKAVPIFICSGGNNDVLSLKSTRLDQKCKELGFKNITVNIGKDNCEHGNLYGMFDSEKTGSKSSYTDFIENLGKQKKDS